MNSFSKRIETFCNHQTFVCFMVIAWMAIEFSIACMIKQESIYPFGDNLCTLIGYWSFVAIFLILFICKLASNNFKISPLTLKKMMTNALGYKWLSFLFIITFSMQLTWFINSTYKVFVDADFTLSAWQEGGKGILTLMSMLIINILFPIAPYSQKNLSIKERDLLITTLSLQGGNVLTNNNIDLFLKPFIYQMNGETFSIKKIVVIISDVLFSSKYADDVRSKYQIEQENIDENSFVKLIRSICHNDMMNVVLSAPVNYDDFQSVYKEADRQLRLNEDGESNQTVVHISPGTAITSGALTSLAIKANRLLLYTMQRGERCPQIFDINVFTVEDLLTELWGEYEINS